MASESPVSRDNWLGKQQLAGFLLSALAACAGWMLNETRINSQQQQALDDRDSQRSRNQASRDREIDHLDTELGRMDARLIALEARCRNEYR